MAVDQHAVHAGKSIPVLTWSIPVQKWNSPQGGQVHYTDAASGASYDRGRFSAVYFNFFILYFNCACYTECVSVNSMSE